MKYSQQRKNDIMQDEPYPPHIAAFVRTVKLRPEQTSAFEEIKREILQHLREATVLPLDSAALLVRFAVSF
jgi:hypothetical protein